jgi:hypothetical protein
MADIGRLADLPENQLEQALADLGRLIEFPRSPDIASAIRSRLETEPVAPKTEPTNVRFLTPWRALAVAAAVALLFLGAALAGLPDFRHAVADRLGVRGIKIVFEDETPTPESSPVGISFLLGSRVTLDEAKDAVPFALEAPTLPGVGEPDEVYLRTLADGRPMVSFVYYPSNVLPETAETGAGALLMQFQAEGDVDVLSKGIGEGGTVVQTEVNVSNAYFITGPSNFFMAVDPTSIYGGGPLTRPSGNVLLWQEGTVTYRLESWLDSVDSVDFAESLRPVPR